MKLTAENSWKHYPKGCHVYLDGKQVGDVIEADDKAGYLVRYKRHPFTKRLIVRGDEIARERVEGKIRFESK